MGSPPSAISAGVSDDEKSQRAAELRARLRAATIRHSAPSRETGIDISAQRGPAPEASQAQARSPERKPVARPNPSPRLGRNRTSHTKSEPPCDTRGDKRNAFQIANAATTAAT